MSVYKGNLLNLLAVIHRDGGHYTDKHGVDKSIDDAERKVAALLAGTPEGFIVGQRVIYQNVICTIAPPDHMRDFEKIWINNPERGYKHWVSPSNLKPLPNGQL
jgi:hypothetical protein